MPVRLLVDLKQRLGVDSAIAYTVGARGCAIVGSAGTVLLLVRFMSPVEQGYYYTLLSLAFLQILFEMGFSFVIQQLAAHESVSCVFRPDGAVEGDAVAHARLASVLQLTVRWYLRAALALVAILAPVGAWFFSRQANFGESVDWQGPWFATVGGCALNLVLTPLYSFLEGCNQVREVAKLRLLQAAAVALMSWAAMISHHGLYASAMVNAAAAAVGAIFLGTRTKLLLGLYRHRIPVHAVSWRTEVWPFQWRSAVSWSCSYFTAQVFTPLLFASRGPVEAGRMGVSLSIVGHLPILVLSWITTKATPFGRLVRLGRLQELDRVFFRALRQALLLLLIGALACLIGVAVVWRALPAIAGRIVSPPVFMLILATGVLTFLVQAMAVYLRCFKQEPYLGQSVAVAALSMAAVWFAAPRWGTGGVAVSYALCSGVIGLASASAIFAAKRRQHHLHAGRAAAMARECIRSSASAALQTRASTSALGSKT